MFVQYSVADYEHVKSSVFNLRFNTGSDGDKSLKSDAVKTPAHAFTCSLD